jgi:DNA polymerase III subunit gamma/tau
VSYQVIARKYRPQTFSDLAGQEHISRTLSNSLETKRLHHAYVFAGVRGTGKTTSARIFAKGLNCIKGITSTPCLECDSCLEIAAANAIDVREIDAASYTGVESVREMIINGLAIGPARDRYKIFIIDEVHMLSVNAFNALLKTLEEPPPHVVFVMATTALHKVPDTILSRCQQFEFREIPTEKIFRRLREIAGKEGIDITESALQEIARSGSGSLRDAQSALDQVIGFSGPTIRDQDVYAALGLVGTEILDRTTQALSSKDSKALLDAVEEISSRGYDPRKFTNELMSWLRNLLLVKSGIGTADALGVVDSEAGRLKELAEDFSEEDLVRSFHLLTEVENDIKDSPVPRFALEVGLLKLVHMLQLQPIPDLVKRLEALEASSTSGGELPAVPVSRPAAKVTRSAAEEPPERTLAPRAVNAPRPAEAPRRVEPRRQSTPAAPAPAKESPVPEEPEWLGSFEPPEEIYEPIASPPIRSAPPQVPVEHHARRSRDVEAIIEEIEKRNRRYLASAFDEATSVDYKDGVLTFTFPANNAFATRVRDSQTLLKEIGDLLFNQAMSVAVIIGGNGTSPVDEAKAAREALRERARKNQGVHLLLEGLQGEIVEVRENQEKGK